VRYGIKKENSYSTIGSKSKNVVIMKSFKNQYFKNLQKYKLPLTKIKKKNALDIISKSFEDSS